MLWFLQDLDDNFKGIVTDLCKYKRMQMQFYLQLKEKIYQNH